MQRNPPPRKFGIAITLMVSMCLSLSACAQRPAEATGPVNSASAALSTGRADSSLVYFGTVPSFNSARAMQYVREIVSFGPRPIGSANHRKVEEYIVAHLAGNTVEADVFT